jgi:hypothetical protein
MSTPAEKENTEPIVNEYVIGASQFGSDPKSVLSEETTTMEVSNIVLEANVITINGIEYAPVKQEIEQG